MQVSKVLALPNRYCQIFGDLVLVEVRACHEDTGRKDGHSVASKEPSACEKSTQAQRPCVTKRETGSSLKPLDLGFRESTVTPAVENELSWDSAIAVLISEICLSTLAQTFQRKCGINVMMLTLVECDKRDALPLCKRDYPAIFQLQALDCDKSTLQNKYLPVVEEFRFAVSGGHGIYTLCDGSSPWKRLKRSM